MPNGSFVLGTSSDLHLLGLVIDENDRQKRTAYIDEQGIDWPQAVTDD